MELDDEVDRHSMEEDEEEEGAGEDLRPGFDNDDSSEEEDEDSEEERRIREGFIVDDDEDDDDRKRRKKNKRRKKHREEAGDYGLGELDEDDLELVSSNLGIKPRTKRLKRNKPDRAASPGSDMIDDDLGNEDDQDLPDIRHIFDDERGGRNLIDRTMEGDDDEDEFAGFIENDDDEAEQQPKRKKRPAMAPTSGIDREVWLEIQEVFGNGLDYAWALEEDAEEEKDKPQPTLRDIFEPEEISKRLMTQKDENIRRVDIPERMQIDFERYPSRSKPSDGFEQEESAGKTPPFIFESELKDAASWVAQRISTSIYEKFLATDTLGNDKPLKKEFLTSVESVMRCLFVQHLEVPFIWLQKCDLLVYQNPENEHKNSSFLSRDDLWKIYSLGLKYRTILDRKAHLRKTIGRLQLSEPDLELDSFIATIDSTEGAADVNEWILLKYGKQFKEMQIAEAATAAADNENENDDNNNGSNANNSNNNNNNNNGNTKQKRRKAPSGGIYQLAKQSIVSKLAMEIAMSASELVNDFIDNQKRHFVEDPPGSPEDFAEQYASDGTTFPTAESALKGAKSILTTEIERNPKFRTEIRRFFKANAVVTVQPTDKGMTFIDELHPFYTFKYLQEKPFAEFADSAQFLEILTAEEEDLVTVQVHLTREKDDELNDRLRRIYLSDYTSNLARAWNEVRASIVETAVQRLIPSIANWAKDILREDAIEYAGTSASTVLEEYIDVAPYRSNGMDQGQTPAVVAISHGKGDPKRDSLQIVSLDDDGKLRASLVLDNLKQPEHTQSLQEFLQEQQPDVVVLGGFSANTARLQDEVKIVVEGANNYLQSQADNVQDPDEREDPIQMEVIFSFDQTARLYQNSPRSNTDFPKLSALARYCVGLARYVQSPLHEYIALEKDLTAVFYHSSQKYLSEERLLSYLERALINVVNSIGVALNDCIDNAYTAKALPFVAGMGPRKARSLLAKIRQSVGIVLCRRVLYNEEEEQTFMGEKVYENVSSFLKFDYDDVRKAAPTSLQDKLLGPDILDSTRIHPTDYEVARKMTADALELDEEDLQDLDHPSDVVRQLMDGSTSKLDELSLDDFAIELQNMFGVNKRLTLYMIRDELKKPYFDHRERFKLPSEAQVFTMLTGETKQVLDFGLIIPARIMNTRRRDGGISVRLDSGLEGVIPAGYLTDPTETVDPATARNRFQVGQVVSAMVTDIKHSEFFVELSVQPSAISQGDLSRRQATIDQYFDTTQANLDKTSMEARKKKSTGGRTRRLIEHPSFFNYNSGQAEQHLAGAQRGDCVIRPSSRGSDHLAVTWKVDEGLFQHIDILELDKPNESMLGRTLRVSGTYNYSDLDELIVSHIRSLSRKVDELTMSEKYKASEAELHTYLTNFCMAHLDRSAYGFALDRNEPGSFILAFKANKNTPVQQWPVRVIPGAFVLPKQGEMNEAVCQDVVQLCNAFKTRYSARQSIASSGGGRTVYGRTPYMQGGATPGYNNTRTPNPYMRGYGTTPAYGGNTAYGGGARTPYGGSRTPYGSYR